MESLENKAQFYTILLLQFDNYLLIDHLIQRQNRWNYLNLLD